MTLEREIHAAFDTDTVRVYQAYHDRIADEVLRLGNFGTYFKPGKTTWLKPTFLWMMHRCNWGARRGQSRILAIDIKRDGFDRILTETVRSTYSEELYGSLEQWQKLLQTTEARSQWSPSRDALGIRQRHLSVQLGIRGELLRLYSDDWIVKISDLTEMVQHLRSIRDQGKLIADLLPTEQPYPLSCD
ncbi:MAG: DUF4291 domain-containing protein [Coriobacteriales bacterium]|nr:DUF4291 domain-containing protein [Coriobacteriales bacterium]